ncbi:hypothetical protein P7C70_g790, partial [Phenoliferia sp. Uapishka_3]
MDNPPEKFAKVYERAANLGIKHLTGHVGEEGPGMFCPLYSSGRRRSPKWIHSLSAAYVQTAVVDLGLRIIDHGTHAADEPETLKLLKEKIVFMAVCPPSCVRIRCVNKVADLLPILKFMETAVKFSINSDNPALVQFVDACLDLSDTLKPSHAPSQILRRRVNGTSKAVK